MNRTVLVLMWMNRHYNHQERCTTGAEKHANIAERSTTTRSRTASESISWYVTNLSWWFAIDYCTDINNCRREGQKFDLLPLSISVGRHTPTPSMWWLEQLLWPLVRLGAVTFHLLTLKLLRYVTRRTDSLSTHFGTSATFLCLPVGKHASNWRREVITLISDLCGHRECRWCGSSSWIRSSSSKSVDLPVQKLWLIFVHGVKRPFSPFDVQICVQCHPR